MSKPRGAIAAGHPETVKAAEMILREGGNAFDAVLAAQLTAFVAEPVLTSLGGGGFLMAETNPGKQILYDFFVQTPISKKDPAGLDFYPISADFGEALQEYHIGSGSIAVPGMVKGLFEIHRDLCSIPLQTLAEPAIELARRGVKMNSFQSGVFDIVRPIYRSSRGAKDIFRSTNNPGELIRTGEILKQPELANILEELVINGDQLFYKGEIAESISGISREEGGHLSMDDLQSYRVIKRNPLEITYRGQEIMINPPPSSGGLLIGFALKLKNEFEKIPAEYGTADYVSRLAQIQQLTDKARLDALVNNPNEDPDSMILDPDYLSVYKEEILNRMSAFRGTTQISIADKKGNLASLTSSNGEGSGVMIPGTGIMLNNMLGEQDLNPGGFHSWQPNERVTSMMAPGILKMNGDTSIAFGSGGSNRIRTAILQLLMHVIDYEMPLKDAVNAPRIHIEDNLLNSEVNLNKKEYSGLRKFYPNQKIWGKKSLYFGGAHSVGRWPKGFSGAGDVRRGGVGRVVL